MSQHPISIPSELHFKIFSYIVPTKSAQIIKKYYKFAFKLLEFIEMMIFFDINEINIETNQYINYDEFIEKRKLSSWAIIRNYIKFFQYDNYENFLLPSKQEWLRENLYVLDL